jgi:hypothetical protein
MTSARVVAAIKQVRASTPRECDGWCRTYGTGVLHSYACWKRWLARVDAALARAVEAAIAAGREPVKVLEQSRIIDLDPAAGSTYEVWWVAVGDPEATKFDSAREAEARAIAMQLGAALAAFERAAYP